MTELKKFLLGLMLLGAVTYFGGGGTWASFSAETSNGGNAISSGTLTMSDQINSGGLCLTANATSANNVNPACGAALTLTNVAPGIAASTAKITIQNTGSIDASKFAVWASSTNATLNAAITSGNSVTSLTVSGLEGTVASGDTIVLSYGANTQTFLATAVATPPATTISVQASPAGPATANANYSIGATVTDTTSDTNSGSTAANNTDCYDRQTTSPGTVGATKGTDLNFNPILGNPFCARALLFVQETTGGLNYCWYGSGSPIDPIAPAVGEAVSGLCAIPIIGVTTSGVLTFPGNITSIPITPTTLNGSVSAGDQIVVTSGAHTETFTASAAANFLIGSTGVTSIPVTSQAVTTPTFPAGSTVVDLTAANAMNSDTTSTLANFDTAHHSTGPIQLPPVTASGTANATASVQLAHNATRTFLVGLYMPAPSGINQNFLQGLVSTFGITWHIDQ